MQKNMKKNKNNSSIFGNCDVSASQEVYLQRCGFAEHGKPPPDSVLTVGVSSPPLNDGGVASHRPSDDSESESVIGYDVVESEAIRLVSPGESMDTVDFEEGEADLTVESVTEKQKDVSMESSGNRRDERLESSAQENERKNLKILLSDVVKTLVMNSRKPEEEIETTSCVQVLMNKGFKF